LKSAFFLAWRYVSYHRARTAILVVCVALTMFLPLGVHLLVDAYDAELGARAGSTPLLLGAKGNRFDLVLKSLWFRAGRVEPVRAGLVDEVRASGWADALPLHVRFTARGAPIVGTSVEYFAFRGLRPREGRLPGILGEAVAGSAAAASLDVTVDGTVLSDQQDVYDLAASIPVRLHVVGVLAPSGTADDFAVFVDVRTAWVMEGIGHGHVDLTGDGAAAQVLARENGHVRANAAVETRVEIARESLASFHFHGDPAEFPLSALIVVPHDEKGRTIVSARYAAGSEWQIVAPQDVVRELLGVVVRVEAFFDVNFAVVALSNGLFLALVVLLSMRLRKSERETMHRLGSSRRIVLRLQLAELVLIIAASTVLAGLAAFVLLALAPELFEVL